MRVSFGLLIAKYELKFSLKAITQMSLSLDFTRLKLVQGKKQQEIKELEKVKEKEKLAILAAGKSLSSGKENSQDITSQFDAADDAEVVF